MNVPINLPPDHERFEQFDLGDALGQDDQLRTFIESLNDSINEDAPRTGSNWTRNLLWLWECTGLPFCLSTLSSAVEWVWTRFSDHEIRKAKAERIRAEATAIESVAKTSAKVELQKATAAVKQANTETIRQQNELSRQLAEWLTAQGIDWQSEIERDGRLRIAVTKKRDL